MEGIYTIIELIKEIMIDFIIVRGIQQGDIGAIVVGVLFVAFLVGMLALILKLIVKESGIGRR